MPLRRKICFPLFDVKEEMLDKILLINQPALSHCAIAYTKKLLFPILAINNIYELAVSHYDIFNISFNKILLCYY